MVSTPSRKSERSVYFFTLMDNQISPNGSDFNPVSNRKPRSFRPVFIGLGVVVLIVVFWFVYLVFFGPDATRDFEAQKNYNQAMKAIGAYEEAMRNDTYGGKTPQETLNLFIDALEKEDVELASKYFILRSDGSKNMAFFELLQKIKNEGNIKRFISDLQNYAKPQKSNLDENFAYILYNNDGTVGLQIDMKFNKYSGVWKIESM